MRRVLIANRGEIAVRITRACRAAGLQVVIAHSTADSTARYLREADRSVCIGPAPAAQSYLHADALLAAATGTGCDALHPGYGFLAESATFARRCRELGLIFIGPDPETIELMGDKVAARRAASAAGVEVVPGSEGAIADAAAARQVAEGIGFPLLIKASGGGGGRGMRVAADARGLEAAIESARAEARAAFGNPEVYLERYFPRVRHVEVQVLGDAAGRVVHLGERDCSVQRRHQKLVEEAPAPGLAPQARAALCEAAVRLAREGRYRNAGTVEFIVDADGGGFYFIEMNTRIQVEHPVTEVVTGSDLVHEQIRMAAGEAVRVDATAVKAATHAIEWRINAEDPARGFLPTPGEIATWRVPDGDGVRVDTHVYPGWVVSPYYDSLLAKLVVSGEDRESARHRSRDALARFEVSGVSTTIPFFRALVEHEDFVAARVHTRWIDEQARGGLA